MSKDESVLGILLICEAGEPDRRIELQSPAIVMGRAADADVVLDRPAVSRKHTQLKRDDDGRWHLRDLDSRGGTFLNGERVEKARLRPGDVIDINRFKLRLLKAEAHPPGTNWSDTIAPHLSVLTSIAPPKLDIAQITAIHESGRDLLLLESATEQLDALAHTMVGPTVQARWAIALRVDADDPTRPPKMLAFAAADGNGPSDLRISRSTIRAMQQARAPVLANNLGKPGDSEAGVVQMSVVSDNKAEAVVACPLSDEDPHVLLYVNLPPMLGTTEWLALIALAVKQYQQAESLLLAKQAAAERAVMQRDLDNARDIQHSILPKPADHGSLELAWSFEPCDAVGGDIVDACALEDGRVLLVVADVTGHGLPASLSALAVHSTIHACLRNDVPLSRMVTTLNDHLSQYLPPGRFVTLVCLMLNTHDGTFESLNAGHHAPAILAADGTIRSLREADHMPLGIAPLQNVEPQAGQLNPGDTLFFSTDGLTELSDDDGQWLGADRVNELVASLIGEGHDRPASLRKALMKSVTELRRGEPLLDDATFLLARWDG